MLLHKESCFVTNVASKKVIRHYYNFFLHMKFDGDEEYKDPDEAEELMPLEDEDEFLEDDLDLGIAVDDDVAADDDEEDEDEVPIGLEI